VEQNLDHLIDITDQTDSDIFVAKLNEKYQGGPEEVEGANIPTLEDGFD
jgi:hypothetical protein